MIDAIAMYLQNFAFVYFWIVLFFVPFVGYFYFRHYRNAKKSNRFNQFTEDFFQSKASNWLVFCWAFGEALVWFVIPEFLLFLVIFMRINRKRELLVYDISGTALGTIVGLMIHIPTIALLKVPYIYPDMITQVRTWYEQMGIWALVNQPFSGVPYKVFISEVHNFAIPLVLFVVLAVVIRLFRYAATYYLLLAMYPVLHKLFRKHYAILFTVGIAVFTLMLMKVSMLYGGN